MTNLDTAHSQILFLCTGNYYRSRFAEYLFNHHAPKSRLPWRAFSRGLDTAQVGDDAGPISPHTIHALAQRGIALEPEIRAPIALSEQDLHSSQHIVALKHAEHHPLMQRNFPDWLDRVEFWHVHDVDQALPEEALPQIEAAVHGLLKRLSD
jgi:protein-tyrosine phosphatase